METRTQENAHHRCARPGVWDNAQDTRGNQARLASWRMRLLRVSVCVGGAPARRETDVARPDNRLRRWDALVLSGARAYGWLPVRAWSTRCALRGAGSAGDGTDPLVPGAILFDGLNGVTNYVEHNPYRALGRCGLLDAATEGPLTLAPIGAGTRCAECDGQGGLGSAGARVARWHDSGRAGRFQSGVARVHPARRQVFPYAAPFGGEWADLA